MFTHSEKKIGVMLAYCNLLISTIIPFFYTPIMLDILGQAEYGLYSLSSSITSYLNLLNFGMTTAVMRYIVKYKSEGDKEGICNIVGMFTIIYSFLSVLMIIIGLFLSCNCYSFFGNGLTLDEIQTLKILIIIMTFSIPLSLMSSIYSSVLLAFEKFSFKHGLDVLSTVVLPVSYLIVLCLGYASIGMALVGLFVNILFYPPRIYYCYKKLNIIISVKKLPFHLLREIFSFSFIVFLSSLADLLFWSTDKVLIGSYLGTVQVAIYNVGGTFTAIFKSMSTSIASVFSPQATTLVFQNNDMKESSNLMIKVGRIQYLIVSLILTGFIVFGQKFLYYWAGTGYEVSYYIALMTMIPLSVPLIQSTAFNTILAMNKHRFRSNMYIIIAVVNAITTFFVIPYYGILGAAICTGVSYVLGQGVILNIYYLKVVKLDMIKFWMNILNMSLVPVIMLFLCFFLSKFVLIDSLIMLMVYIIIYTFVFCVLSWFFTMNNYEKGLIKDIYSKLFRRII